MNRLSKAQIEHAKSRIRHSAQARKAKLEAKFSSGAELTEEKRASLLRSGKVKMKKSVRRITPYTDVTDAFDFSKFGAQFDEEKYNKECAKIDSESAALMDELMLGDTEEALALIRKLK